MVKTVFKVRVITKDVLTDAFARFRSIIGGRVKAYEKAIQDALEDAYHELVLEFPDVKNVMFGTTELIADGAELIVYGEVSDAEYKRYILKKRGKQKGQRDKKI
jgi:uncharacterized protein YbjQ (UPF0145 family)